MDAFVGKCKRSMMLWKKCIWRIVFNHCGSMRTLNWKGMLESSKHSNHNDQHTHGRRRFGGDLTECHVWVKQVISLGNQ
jgi:hypothetical protein